MTSVSHVSTPTAARQRGTANPPFFSAKNLKWKHSAEFTSTTVQLPPLQCRLLNRESASTAQNVSAATSKNRKVVSGTAKCTNNKSQLSPERWGQLSRKRVTQIAFLAPISFFVIFPSKIIISEFGYFYLALLFYSEYHVVVQNAGNYWVLPAPVSIIVF